MDSLTILHPKILPSCTSTTQNITKNRILIRNFILTESFSVNTEFNQQNVAVAQTFTPPPILPTLNRRSFTPKKCLSSPIPDPKTSHAHHVRKHSKHSS